MLTAVPAAAIPAEPVVTAVVNPSHAAVAAATDLTIWNAKNTL